jgi:hypothetical protein
MLFFSRFFSGGEQLHSESSPDILLCVCFHSSSRITAKAPYQQVNSSVVGVEASKQAAGAGVEKPWLGLGQEATTAKLEM